LLAITSTARQNARESFEPGSGTRQSAMSSHFARGIFVPFDAWTAAATTASDEAAAATKAMSSFSRARTTKTSVEQTPGMEARATLWKYGRNLPNRTSPAENRNLLDVTSAPSPCLSSQRL